MRIERNAGQSRILRYNDKNRRTHDSGGSCDTRNDSRTHGAMPQALGRIGILQEGIGDDQHRKSNVPQNIEPKRALQQPGAKHADGREDARKGKHPREQDERASFSISRARRPPLVAPVRSAMRWKPAQP
jgi:hypothetical protein